VLELKEVSKSFRGPEGEVRALEAISLAVEAGELVVVHGPSGSGKTTLLLVAGGLLRPSGGEVLVEGCDPYRLGPNQRSALRAESVGFVFQQFHLIPYLDVLDNVRAPSVARPPPGAVDRARELVRRFSLEHRFHHVPAQLSTGERQRTALARAVLNRPKLILADEPTGNLDEENAAMVLDYLAEFADQGSAVLLVTHDAGAAGRAHRTFRLDEGKLAPTSPVPGGAAVHAGMNHPSPRKARDQ